jgi:hypothetical protein
MALSNIQKLRTKLNDPYRTFAETHQADGESRDWDCQHYPIQPGTYTAYLDGVSTVAYTANLDDGRFTFSAAPANAAQIKIVGRYSTFSDTELGEIMAEHGLTTGATAATWASLDAPLLACVEMLYADTYKRASWGAAGGQSVNEASLFANVEKWRAMLYAKTHGAETGPQGGISSWAEEQENYPDRYQG